MPTPAFRKATKSSARLRMALIGPAGSGKTFTALTLATALGGRVAVIDTEHGSASKYAPPEGQPADPAAGTFAFDTAGLEDYHPKNYIEAIREAEAADYDVLIIDSLSHAWVGRGGGLDLHDQAVARQKVKNPYTAWAEVTPHHQALVEAMLASKCHVIATMRSKMDYVQEKDERTGKTTVRKVGMAPVMRDGIEYEFDIAGDLDVDNTLAISKTRCPALSGSVIRKPGTALAVTLLLWLGSPSAKPPDGAPPSPGTTKPAANGDARLPANGEELLVRLLDYEKKLCAEGICAEGQLLDHIAQAGDRAGFGLDIKAWGKPGVALASKETRAFEAAARRRLQPAASAGGSGPYAERR